MAAKPTKEQVEQFGPFRERVYEIIFEADTPAGKFFDVSLLIFIVLSILVVMLESVAELDAKYHLLFQVIEWISTIFFTIEYITRLYVVHKPIKYATSFFGIIDLLATLPAYLALFIPGAESFLVIRILRLLRIFRIFKLGAFLRESNALMIAMRNSRNKIIVFLVFILLLVTIIGFAMFIVEQGTNNQFSSIPRSIYWAIVTLTTVGYGDISPTTNFGQFLAAVVMILGYAVIAVPTGIVTNEMSRAERKRRAKKIQTNTQVCRHCLLDKHDDDAIFCKQCGEELNPHITNGNAKHEKS